LPAWAVTWAVWVFSWATTWALTTVWTTWCHSVTIPTNIGWEYYFTWSCVIRSNRTAYSWWINFLNFSTGTKNQNVPYSFTWNIPRYASNLFMDSWYHIWEWFWDIRNYLLSYWYKEWTWSLYTVSSDTLVGSWYLNFQKTNWKTYKPIVLQSTWLLRAEVSLPKYAFLRSWSITANWMYYAYNWTLNLYNLATGSAVWLSGVKWVISFANSWLVLTNFSWNYLTASISIPLTWINIWDYSYATIYKSTNLTSRSSIWTSNIVQLDSKPYVTFASSWLSYFAAQVWVYDNIPPVLTWYVSSWTYLLSWTNTYYKWTISIRADVVESWQALLSWTSCMYNTGWSRASAIFSWNTTTWYCEITWLNYQSDFSIIFRMQDNAWNVWYSNTWAYLYDATAPTWWSFTIDNDNVWTTLTWVTLDITCPTDAWVGWIEIAYGNSSSPSNRTWYTPSDWSIINWNNFVTELQLYDINWIGDFDYVYSWTTYNIYDSWLLLMYNFNKISSLWESWTYIRDFSQYSKNWIATWWVQWITSWVRNWAYNFDWTNKYISIWNWSWVSLWTIHTINLRVKPSSNVWTLLWNSVWMWLYLSWNRIIYSLATNNLVSFNSSVPLNTRTFITIMRNWLNVSLYKNWNIVTTMSLSNNTWLNLLYIWKENNDWSDEKRYSWSIDELFIYNRALQQANLSQHYRANLSVIDTWKWLYSSNYSCVITWWNYIYSWYISDIASNLSSTTRSATINLPSPISNISASSLVIWQMQASITNSQTLSWQSDWNFSVSDWRWNTWWYTTITTPLDLNGVNNNSHAIAWSQIYFKSSGISTVSGWSTNLIYVVWNLSGYVNAPNATTYIKRDSSDIPFMCPGWVYGNKPWFKVNVPAWQAIDSYSGSITYDIIY
jgi:hypothetical protein